MIKCLKVRVNQKKHWICVMGYELDDLKQNPSLIYEILKTIGFTLGIDYLKDIEDFSDVEIETENPDFVVKVNKGKIEVVDFI